MVLRIAMAKVRLHHERLGAGPLTLWYRLLGGEERVGGDTGASPRGLIQ